MTNDLNGRDLLRMAAIGQALGEGRLTLDQAIDVLLCPGAAMPIATARPDPRVPGLLRCSSCDRIVLDRFGYTSLHGPRRDHRAGLPGRGARLRRGTRPNGVRRD